MQNLDFDNITAVAADIVAREYYTETHIDAMSDLGYELFSVDGTDRIVFADGSSVIKIVEYEADTNLNYDEAATWNAVKDTDDEHLFCPVTDTGPHYRWIEMVRCEKTPERINEYELEIINSQWKINDLHADNIGTYTDPQTNEEQLVCFDYPNANQVDSNN